VDGTLGSWSSSGSKLDRFEDSEDLYQARDGQDSVQVLSDAGERDAPAEPMRTLVCADHDAKSGAIGEVDVSHVEDYVRAVAHGAADKRVAQLVRAIYVDLPADDHNDDTWLLSAANADRQV
jgi:hypothetical protein